MSDPDQLMVKAKAAPRTNHAVQLFNLSHECDAPLINHLDDLYQQVIQLQNENKKLKNHIYRRAEMRANG